MERQRQGLCEKADVPVVKKVEPVLLDQLKKVKGRVKMEHPLPVPPQGYNQGQEYDQ